jgi:hypothetical protein
MPDPAAMTSERWSRIKDLFALALAEPAAGRPALLAREAAGDADLVAEVESLLRAHEQPDRFLDAVPAALRAEALDVGGANHVGERIGAYRIVERIGTGGMGDVYKAVRDDDQYRAEVAIKLMRGDLRNPLAGQRFRTERQILAQLDHRNIARLLDGGTTAGGLPYVVMELVAGEPIDRYCDARDLPARQRVQLFLQVCAAVSVAHQHLVVHRDLKPNNILVTADGSVKLLDFGIAKLLEPDPATGAGTDETQTQFRAMTLEYASPEQLSGGAVTTASDVYSLGVVLYRLLTGQSPYRSTGGDAARVAEILGDTTPTRPSQVLTPVERGIDTDLDYILLLALRKEPQKRYGSVEQLANDLRNFLAGRPVLARRGTAAYRFGKFVRRNKVPLAAASLVLLSLAGGLGLALREARIAQRHFDSVRKLANTLVFDIHDEIAQVRGATKARELLVKTSLEYLDALYQESGSDLALRAELAAAYRRIAAVQSNDLTPSLGDAQAAAVSLQRAIALLEPVVRAEPRNDRAAVDLGKTYLEQSRLQLRIAGPAPAKVSGQRAIELLESRKAGYTDDFERASLLASLYFTQAQVLGDDAGSAAGMQMMDRMVAVAEENHRAHPGDRRARTMLAAAYDNAGGSAGDGNAPSAEAAQRQVTLRRKSLEINLGLLAEKPDDVAQEISTAETRYNYGQSLFFSGDFTAAAAQFRQAAPGLAKGVGDASDARAQWAQATNSVWWAASLTRLGMAREAASHVASGEESLLRLNRQSPDDVQNTYGLATARVVRGEVYQRMSEVEPAGSQQRRRLLQQARDAATSGIEAFARINGTYPLAGTDRLPWEWGVKVRDEATLALAQAN